MLKDGMLEMTGTANICLFLKIYFLLQIRIENVNMSQKINLMRIVKIF
jgi:hypothetical protein